MGFLRTSALLLLALACAVPAARAQEEPPAGAKPDATERGDAADRAEEPPAAAAPRTMSLAVIVHPDNPVTRISFNELRAYLKMERQFWPNNRRCVIFLPPSGRPESDFLLEKIYRMSHRKLQKYWVRRLFSGDIPSKPAYVPSARAAGLQVLQNPGALSVVDAAEVPERVRVLQIDGRKPGDEGYPLTFALPEPEDGQGTGGEAPGNGAGGDPGP